MLNSDAWKLGILLIITKTITITTTADIVITTIISSNHRIAIILDVATVMS